MTPSTNRRRLLTILSSTAVLGICLCAMLACATEVYLMNNRTSNQVILCLYTANTGISLEYINPYMSQRILKPSLNPPCVAVPWAPSLPQFGQVHWP